MIIQMKPLWQYFDVVLFIFQPLCKVKFWNFVEIFTLCVFGSVRLIIRLTS